MPAGQDELQVVRLDVFEAGLARLDRQTLHVVQSSPRWTNLRFELRSFDLHAFKLPSIELQSFDVPEVELLSKLQSVDTQKVELCVAELLVLLQLEFELQQQTELHDPAELSDVEFRDGVGEAELHAQAELHEIHGCLCRGHRFSYRRPGGRVSEVGLVGICGLERVAFRVSDTCVN